MFSPLQGTRVCVGLFPPYPFLLPRGPYQSGKHMSSWETSHFRSLCCGALGPLVRCTELLLAQRPGTLNSLHSGVPDSRESEISLPFAGSGGLAHG